MIESIKLFWFDKKLKKNQLNQILKEGQKYWSKKEKMFEIILKRLNSQHFKVAFTMMKESGMNRNKIRKNQYN